MISARLDYEYFRADALQRFQAIDELARGALRGLTLGNGGAIVALFTFIGNEGARGHYDAKLVWAAFACFLAGLIAVFAASIVGYVSQSKYMETSIAEAWNAQGKFTGAGGSYDAAKPRRQGTVAEFIAVGGGVVSLIAFAVGGYLALAGVL